MPVEEDLNFLFVDGQNMSGIGQAQGSISLSLFT
jgi:hypothetical protein